MAVSSNREDTLMVRDLEHRGTPYRIISEEPSLAHPEFYMVCAYEIKPGGGAEKIFEHRGDQANFAWAVSEADRTIMKR